MRKYFLYQQKTIHYTVLGHGQPVVLVHGFGEDSTVWDKQAAFLQHRFRLLIPDLPGSGDSEMTDKMSMESMAEMLYALTAEEQLKDYSVIGHSMGGYITLALAEKYGETICSFGLFHSSAYADSEEKKDTRRKGIDFIQQHGAYGFLKTSTPNLFSPQSRDEHPEWISELLAKGKKCSSAALVAYYEAMMNRPKRTNLLENTGIPVLFVMGKYDNAVPLEQGLEQCHLPGNSYIHILQKSGHMGMLEESGRSNRLLEQFLQETCR